MIATYCSNLAQHSLKYKFMPKHSLRKSKAEFNIDENISGMVAFTGQQKCVYLHYSKNLLQQSSTEITLFDDSFRCNSQPTDVRSIWRTSVGVKRQSQPFSVDDEPSAHSAPSQFDLAQWPHRTQYRDTSASSRECNVADVLAVQAISGMRGGAQSKLMLCDDSNLWVVKFKNNPQHPLVLVNELIATRMAESIGLPVPTTGIIDVGEWLIENSPQLYMDNASRGGRERCSSGLQFGSKFVGGLMPRQVIDFLPEERLQTLRNFGQFIGMLAFDKWTCNRDGRQVVYQRTSKERDYRAVFVDQGFCFGTPEWKFVDAPLQGIHACKRVYSEVTGWSDFEPWLARIERFDPQILWSIASSVPQEWYGGNQVQLECLVATLLQRRERVTELVDQFRKSDAHPFPRWKIKLRTCGIAPMRAKRIKPAMRAAGFLPDLITEKPRITYADATKTKRKSDDAWQQSALMNQTLFLPAQLNQWLVANF